MSIADNNWSPTKKYICLLGISDAMRFLHKCGIIHRDLKPQNILVDSNFYPKVCDCGLSRCFSMTGQIGTPLYMSPEMFEDEEHFGPAVDVYAFAILAYEIVTGKEPFAEDGKQPTFSAIIKNIRNLKRPVFTSSIPDNMKDLIEKCWSQDPKERPSFDEIFEKLSTDFSYSEETVDEDEINEYLEMLEENRKEAEVESKSKNEEENKNLRNEIDALKISHEEEINKKYDEIKNLRNEIDALKDENKGYKEKITVLQNELDKLKNQDQNESESKCLHVKICEAQKILNLRLFGKMDSFVTLRLKSQNNEDDELCTQTISNTKDPVWNEDFELISTEKDDVLIINMYSNDPKGNEKIMDQLEFPVGEWKINGPVDRKEINIFLKKKKAGTLIFEVQAFPAIGEHSKKSRKLCSSSLNDQKINWNLPKNFRIKLIMLAGSSGAGKTALLKRYIEGFFNPNLPATIGIDFGIKTINIDNHEVTLQIWDTASQERFRHITRSYLTSSQGFIVFFDLSNKESFHDVRNVIDEFKEINLDPKVPVILVGNKIDLGNRQVLYEDAEKFASEKGWKYFETSAINNTGIDEMFRFIAIKALQYCTSNKKK